MPGDHGATFYAAFNLSESKRKWPLAGDWINLDLGDYGRALEYLGRVIVDYPDSPQLGDVLLYRGVCQMKLGQNPDALRTFYQVSEEHPGSESASKAQQYIESINQKPAKQQ